MAQVSGKGSGRRPESDGSYSAGWDAIFGRKADQALADRMRAENLAKSTGRSSTAEQGALTASVVGSNPTAPAIYIDDASG